MALPDNLPEKLDGLTWAELAYLCDLSREAPDEYYAKYGGQTVTLTMQNTDYSAETVTARCDDCGNMDRVAGGKCGLHFTVIEGLKCQQMNTSSTTSGGYSGSNFYRTILPEIIKALPADIQKYLDPLTVHVNLASSGTTLTAVNGKMHLVTMKQWFGQKNIDATSWTSTCRTWWDKEEEWLKWNSEHDTNNDRIVKNDTGATYDGWTASVYDSNDFGRIYNNGTQGYNYAYFSYVPVLGFSLTNGGENPGVPWAPAPPAYYLNGAYRGEDGSQPQTLAWTEANADDPFLDETGNWSVIEIAQRLPDDIADITWPEVSELANKAAKDLTNPDYQKYVGQEKTLTIGGNTVTARIVGIGEDTLKNGGVAGFTFNPYRGMATHNMNGSNTTTGGYASSAMKTWLEGLAFQSDVSAALQEHEVKYCDTPSGSAKTLYAKFSLMAASNVYWAGCQGNNGYDSYFYSDEGEPYSYFKNANTTASKIHYNASNGANNAWLLSPYDSSYFMGIHSNGFANYYYAFNTYLPAARFCLGSSI